MVQSGTYNRLQSLDIFRGIIVCGMIIVGASGNYAYTYRMLDHAPWTGFTPTDFIFPSFLFIIGVAQSLSFKGKAADAAVVRPPMVKLVKIFKRTAILFLWGWLLNWFPFCYKDSTGHIQWISPDQVRTLGVLQRIALAYGITSLLEIYLSPRNLIRFSVLALITYILLLHLGGSADPYGVAGNTVARIDLAILGPAHMYREQGLPFDPEGLLSTLPAIVNVIGGYLTGRLLLRKTFAAADLVRAMIIGCGLFVIGYLWSYLDPVNKKLWTSSYVLITLGMDILLFTAIVFYTDVQQKNLPLAGFFTCFGKNPILIYLFAESCMKLLLFPVSASGEAVYGLLYKRLFANAGLYVGSLLQALTYMLFCWSLVWFLHKKKFYLKI